jgi:hypothetical protein
MLALASCEGSEERIEAHTSALSTHTLRIYHDNPPRPTGCENRDYAGDGDWAYGLCKTECNVPATGLSSSFAAQGVCDIPEFPDDVPADLRLDPPPGPTSYVEFTHELACGNNGAPGVVLGSGYTLVFGTTNNQAFPTIGRDWAPGLDKGECDNSSAVVGVGTTQLWDGDNSCFRIGSGEFNSQKRAYGMAAVRCSTLQSTDPAKVAVAYDCQTVYFDNASRNEAGNRTSWLGEDWGYGLLKGEWTESIHQGDRASRI